MEFQHQAGSKNVFWKISEKDDEMTIPTNSRDSYRN